MDIKICNKFLSFMIYVSIILKRILSLSNSTRILSKYFQLHSSFYLENGKVLLKHASIFLRRCVESNISFTSITKLSLASSLLFIFLVLLFLDKTFANTEDFFYFIIIYFVLFLSHFYVVSLIFVFYSPQFLPISNIFLAL